MALFAGPLAPLRHRQFRLLWTGMSASLIGDGMLLVALAWQVYDLFGVPAAMSAVGVALSLPQVAMLLVGGVISDRFDPRQVMLVSDLLRGLVMAGVAVLSLTGTLTSLWMLLGLVMVYGAAAGFFGPSFDALVPRIVPAEDLVEANALDQFVRPAGLQIFGPMLAGAVIAVAGVGWTFAFDAATFLFSVLCLLAMRRVAPAPAPSPEISDSPGVSIWQDMREGIGYVRKHVWLWGTFLSATFTYLLFVGPTEVLLPYVIKTELGGSATALSLVLTSGGLGAIAAALIVGWIGIPRRFMTYIYGTWAIATLAVAGYGLGTRTWQLAVACVVVNGLEAAGTIAWATTKQHFVPTAMLGRVSSVDWFVSTALLPLSYALAAPVAQWIGVRDTLLGAGLLGAAVTFGFLFLPGMRNPERQAAYEARHSTGTPRLRTHAESREQEMVPA
ncbi:tetracycline efflux MFS transporter Tet(V) [Paractinoplanes ferrugineus]|uniref:Tetracycline efflux MFS transporter Tet(V) n=1 Tax=Paractinoplanes ferrugineus TaxID=113564 RepID=A0A919MK05_9ACTN|nr:MFS transporter [Actinoplanes ferrugineus]GIE10697.1 tetracycline efflux MFS transporter Tet(V) [Actinoplanes ferrugineus]